MALMTTNILTLAVRQLLIGSSITLEDDKVIVPVTFTVDPITHAFIIEATDGEEYHIDAKTTGTVDIPGEASPNGSVKNKNKKIKK
jgi:hypothetical protein